MSIRDRVVLLIGGVGGAKMAVGLAGVLPPKNLSIIVNTGDDFEHLGLYICPDLDTVMYSLVGIANPRTGWGIARDTSNAMRMLRRYALAEWFHLSDSDLGTHVARTYWLAQGKTLTETTRLLAQGLGVGCSILPMTDDRVRTHIYSDEGKLAFQEYFVREKWQPRARRITYQGAEQASASGEVLRALDDATLIVFGPSNPYLSIDPILAVGDIRARIINRQVPVIAISPIVAGKVLKGPAAKLMAELGQDVSAFGVAQHYEGLINGFIMDLADTEWVNHIESLHIRSGVHNIVMKSSIDKVRLAEAVLAWVEETLS